MAGAEKLRGAEPGKQKLAEGPASSCKPPTGRLAYAVPLQEESRVQVVVSWFLAAAVKILEKEPESKVCLLFHQMCDLTLKAGDQVQLLASRSLEALQADLG